MQALRASLLVLAFALPTFLEASAHANPMPAPVSVDERVKRAERATADGHYDEALKHFRAAWALEKAHDTACNIGRIAFRQGYAREAAEFLTRCRDMAPPASGPKEKARQAAERKELEDVERTVGILRITVSGPGAEVFVDDERIGLSPVEPKVFVDPGHRRVRATRGAERAESAFTIAAGEARVVDLKLDMPKAPQKPPAPPVPSAPSPPLSPKKEVPAPPPSPPSGPFLQVSALKVAVGAGVLTAASLGAAIVHVVLANDAQSDARGQIGEARTKSLGSCQGDRSAPGCKDYWNAEGKRERNSTIANGFFAGAGAIAFTGGAAAFFVSRW